MNNLLGIINVIFALCVLLGAKNPPKIIKKDVNRKFL